MTMPNTKITQASRLQSNHLSYIFAEIDSEMVLMHLDTGEYYGMDSTTTEIWKMLEEAGTIGDLVEDFTERYEVDAEQCEADLSPVLENMVEHEFVILVD